MGKNPETEIAVIDSKSVRWGGPNYKITFCPGGVFLVLFFHLFSHSRKAAPSKMKENTLKIRRPDIKKF